MYVNLDWDVKVFHDISEVFLKMNQSSEDYIRMETLSKPELLVEFLKRIQENEILYVYDFSSLNLTLAEFKLLYEGLVEKHAEIRFLHEKESFLENLLLIAIHESHVQSVRIKKGIEIKKLEGKSIGRPKIDEKLQKRIYQLYFDQKYTMRQIASEMNVSLGTVFNYVSKAKDHLHQVS